MATRRRTAKSSRQTPEVSPKAVTGCLVDVSGSMQTALESGAVDEQAVDRLHAVIRAALELARAELHRNPNSLMFVCAFGMKDHQLSIIDLCGVFESIVASQSGHAPQATGHENLIALANEKGMPHITEYIRTRLSEREARIVYRHLSRHPEQVQDFVDTIPSPEVLAHAGKRVENAKTGTIVASAVGTFAAMMLTGGLGAIAGPAIQLGGHKFVNLQENAAIEDSDAMRLARHICKTWLRDFEDVKLRPVSEMLSLLERLHQEWQDSRAKSSFFAELEPHIYGATPLRGALSRILDLFRSYTKISEKILVLLSDGCSTDGDPLPLADALKLEGVHVSTVFLTNERSLEERCLYDDVVRLPAPSQGQTVLFKMASTISAFAWPVPTLAALGWQLPSSGVCALYASVSTTQAMDEFCSNLLSARLGYTEDILDVFGKFDLDAFVNDKHVRTCQKPSQQGSSGTCYAHATAAILHMALVRIRGREGGCPRISKIRKEILKKFPETAEGYSTPEVLSEMILQYRPLRFVEIDETGARQALLHRRPVLATFHLTHGGWQAFDEHFQDPELRGVPLSYAKMSKHQLSRIPARSEGGGGHAVVLVRCSPTSLTFLNSWGKDWGNDGSFSIESAETLRISSVAAWSRMAFYDVFWHECDLTDGERRAYDAIVSRKLRSTARRYPSLLRVGIRCPCCHQSAPAEEYTGNILEARCYLCLRFFRPQAPDLLEALNVRTALNATGS